MQAAFTVVVILLVILYVLSIVWVVRDAYLRGSYWYVWAIVALVPLLGIIAYCLLRPPLLQIDRDEQELEIALKQRELMKYGECANCGYPVEADFVLCPNCHQRLKNLCGTCNHALDPVVDRVPVLRDPRGRWSAHASRPAAAPRARTQQPQQAAPQQQAEAGPAPRKASIPPRNPRCRSKPPRSRGGFVCLLSAASVETVCRGTFRPFCGIG